MHGGVQVRVHIFLTSALDGGERSANNPRRFTSGKEPPGTYCPENGLDTLKSGTEHKNKRPHDKKYMTHSIEENSIMTSHSRRPEETHII
jgi:hypothetical protein